MRKRLLSMLLILAMIFSMLSIISVTANAATYSGTCGDDVTWELDTDTGVLTISGVDYMDNFTADDEAWDYYRDYIKTVIITDGVTSIGGYAFDNCVNLTSVEIPESVETIEGYAFRNCVNLCSVEIPEGVETISVHAFNNCVNLTSVEIPESVETIWGYAFYNCVKLTSVTIPDSVTTIGASAFEDCDSLTSVEIPADVYNIGSGAFAWCSSLASVTIRCERVGSYMFFGCENLTSVELSDGVTTIRGYAFGSCTGLTSITIPDSVTSIDDYAFFGATSLRHIHFLGDTPTIGSKAFDSCSSDLKLCYMEGTKGWENCTYATEPWDYTQSENCTSITYTCNDCGGSYTKKFDPPKHSCLNAVDNGDGTHSGTCSCGEAITEEHRFVKGSCICGVVGGSCGDNVNWSFNTSTGVLVVYGKGDMKNQIAYETDWYSYQYDIKTVIIKDGVTRIGDYAFFNCYSLKSVTIPDSVTGIGDYAFYNCDSLKSVTIPDSVTSIGDDAFCACDNLTSVTIPDSVTSIGNYAFCACNSLTSVEIPDSVTSIGNEAFFYCENLTGIWVSSENEYYSSDDSGVLFNKDKTTLLQATRRYGAYVIPNSVTKIGPRAFFECNFTSITIPDSVTTISDEAFSHCAKLSSVTIGDGVTSIGSNAFSYCDSLTSIEIPDSVTSMGNFAFRGCYRLTSVELSDSLTIIGNYAFDSCRITSVTIPAGVTGIYDYAFANCSYLRHVHFLGDMPTILRFEAFYACPLDLKLCYMEGTKGWENCTYTAEPWDYTATEHCPNVTYTCNDCGGSYTKKLDPPKHSCLNAVDNGEGTHSGTCSCGEAITEEHRFVNGSCICGAVEITQPILDASLTFGAQLYLENDLTMAFRVKQDKLAAYDISTAYLVVERDIYETGAAQATVETMTINEYKIENGRLIFSYPGIAAAQMNDSIRATFYIKNAKGQEYVSPVVDTSVATYLDGLLTASASDAKLVTLVMDMVNYGAAAQVYFDRHADAPVNEAFESFKTYASYASADFRTALENLSATENAEGKSGKLNLSLDLGTRIGIQYKVTVPSNVNVEDVTVVVTDSNGNVLETLTVAGNATDSRGRYLVNFYGSTSRDMRRVVYATAYANGEAITGTYAYSISSYAWGVQENAGTQPADLVNVTRAMLLYGDSAAAYFG